MMFSNFPEDLLVLSSEQHIQSSARITVKLAMKITSRFILLSFSINCPPTIFYVHCNVMDMIYSQFSHQLNVMRWNCGYKCCNVLRNQWVGSIKRTSAQRMREGSSAAAIKFVNSMDTWFHFMFHAGMFIFELTAQLFLHAWNVGTYRQLSLWCRISALCEARLNFWLMWCWLTEYLLYKRYAGATPDHGV